MDLLNKKTDFKLENTYIAEEACEALGTINALHRQLLKVLTTGQARYVTACIKAYRAWTNLKIE